MTTATNGMPHSQGIIYVQQPVKEEGKNLIEGALWGVNGLVNIGAAIASIAGLAALDSMAFGAFVAANASGAMPPEALVASSVGLAALNVLGYYVVKAEASIAGKSFTHMLNTIY